MPAAGAQKPAAQAAPQKAAPQNGAPQKAAPQNGTPQAGVQKPAPQSAPQKAAPQTGAQKAAPQAAPKTPAPQVAPQNPAPARPAQGRPAGEQARKQAAQAKAGVIDGPTRHIDRTDLAKDLPDLSEVRHPTPVPAPAAEPAKATGKRPPVVVAAATPVGDPLRASVQIRKVDPWSTLKVALVLSVAMFFVWMFAIGFLYVVLDGMGVWDRLNNAFTDIVSETSESGLVTAGQVFGYSALIGGINIILFTALATVGAFIYNLCTDLVGGVEVTLADRD